LSVIPANFGAYDAWSYNLNGKVAEDAIIQE